jgi:hypothetical protein
MRMDFLSQLNMTSACVHVSRHHRRSTSRYDCKSTKEEFDKRQHDVELPSEKCSEVADAGNDTVFGVKLYNVQESVEKIGSQDMANDDDTEEAPARFNLKKDLLQKSTKLQVTHKYKLYETYDECLEDYQCMEPTAKEVAIHKVEDVVKGCLITGLGRTVAEISRAIYLPLESGDGAETCKTGTCDERRSRGTAETKTSGEFVHVCLHKYFCASY